MSASLRERGRSVLRGLGLLEAARDLRRGVSRSSVVRRLSRRRLHRKSLRLLQGLVRPGCLCFDIGANRGDTTALWLELGARVVAVEPQDENLELLGRRFGADSRVEIVPRALGRDDGSIAELWVCNYSDCSSLSPPFVEAVTRSGRLPASLYRWEDRREVRVTSLDALIERYGLPAFCKIDVEGFEAEVLTGLHRPIPALSLEFTPEFIDAALSCIETLSRLGAARFNYVTGRAWSFALTEWVGSRQMKAILRNLPKTVSRGPGGDLYVRFTEVPGAEGGAP